MRIPKFKHPHVNSCSWWDGVPGEGMLEYILSCISIKELHSTT
jgi:hypothetical protein